MNRRGVTLIELLIALALLGGVMLTGLAILGGTATAARRSARLLRDTRITGTLGTLLRYELADVPVADLSVPGSSALLFPRRVGDGLICWSAGHEVVIARSEWHGSRAPEPARDELSLLVDQGFWASSPVVAVASGRCPDGRVAWVLSLNREVASSRYLRVSEPVRLAIYRSGASDWYGLAPADGSTPVQPFAGPLAAATGRITLEPSRLLVAAAAPGSAPVSLTIPLITAGPP